MSFDVDMPTILRYANNVFASALPMIWPFVGVAFAVFLIAGLLLIFRKFADK